MKKAEIGSALDGLAEDVKSQVLHSVADYRDHPTRTEIIRGSVDVPHRAQQQIQLWVDNYNAKNGVGTAAPFLDSCLAAAGSIKTVASVNAEIAALVSQAQSLVNEVNNNGWTWEQVADWLETNVSVEEEEDFTWERLPIPNPYTDIWGDVW